MQTVTVTVRFGRDKAQRISVVIPTEHMDDETLQCTKIDFSDAIGFEMAKLVKLASGVHMAYNRAVDEADEDEDFTESDAESSESSDDEAASSGKRARRHYSESS